MRRVSGRSRPADSRSGRGRSWPARLRPWPSRRWPVRDPGPGARRLPTRGRTDRRRWRSTRRPAVPSASRPQRRAGRSCRPRPNRRPPPSPAPGGGGRRPCGRPRSRRPRALRLNLRVDPDLYRRLRREAADADMSLSAAIRLALLGRCRAGDGGTDRAASCRGCQVGGPANAPSRRADSEFPAGRIRRGGLHRTESNLSPVRDSRSTPAACRSR